MRERDINRKLFNVGHYNVIAKRFSEYLEPYMSEGGTQILQTQDFQQVKSEVQSIRAAIVNLAVDFAIRLQADNEDFDPVMFLNRCSPNVELYPLGELWQEVESNDGNIEA